MSATPSPCLDAPDVVRHLSVVSPSYPTCPMRQRFGTK